MRIRAAIDERFVFVVAALVLLAGIGGWVVYTTHVSPEMQTEEQVVSSWTATGEFQHGATVVNDTEAFAEGTEVTDRSLYFTNAMPLLEGAYAYQYDAPAGELDVHTELELVIRSIDEDEDTEVVYWRVTEPLDEVQTTLGPGDTQEVTFDLDVEATNERIDSIEENLGASPGTVEVMVRARTSIEGTVHGESVEDSVVHDLHIEPDGSTYTVGNPTVHQDSYESIDRATVPVEHGPLRSVGSILLLAGSLLGLAALVGARRRGVLVPDEERTRVERERERAEFDDWISRGRVPPELLDRSRIEVDSLEDLVDVAIDCDRRVIEDGTNYYMIDDGLVYVYEPPEHVRKPIRNINMDEPASNDQNTDADSAEMTNE